MMTQKSKDKIFFVSSPAFPFFPGTGGTETFTFGHIRELQRREFDARILTLAQKVADGRDQLPDIPFTDLSHEQELSDIDATLVGVVDPFIVPTRRPAFIMTHVPPVSTAYTLDRYRLALQQGHKVLTNSLFAQKQWAQHLAVTPENIAVIYPFADQAFAAVKRPTNKSGLTRVLFAGRLSIHKGIYLFLEALHHSLLQKGFRFTVTSAHGHHPDNVVFERFLTHHPWVEFADARTSPLAMAKLLAEQDIVVMPSNHIFWQEAFGMLSVEAQHAGCRVVAAATGGLPETNAGALTLFEPGNSLALAQAIDTARQLGPVSSQTRRHAAKRFTVVQSVDSLLKALGITKN